MVQWIKDAFHQLIVWFFSIIVELVMGILNSLLAVFPGMSPYVQQGVNAWYSLVYWLEVANGWVPVDLALVLVGVYYSFLLMFVSVKYILKLIPTIG